MDRTLDFYRRQPYRRVIERVTESDGTYFICTYPELPGLMADGGSRSEAFHNAEEAFDDYIAARLNWNEDIPLPAAVRPSAGYAEGDVPIMDARAVWVTAPEARPVLDATGFEGDGAFSEVATAEDAQSIAVLPEIITAAA